MANLGTAPPEVPNGWPTLSRLKDMQEPERRRVLRSGIEAGLDSPEEIGFRRQLGEELDRLTGLELELEIDGGSEEQAREALRRIPGFETLVWKSPAFAQFLNAYLYFGIRFAGGRLEEPRTPPAEDTSAEQFNERRVGLPSPPACKAEGILPSQLREDVDAFLGLRDSQETREALAFLDDDSPGDSAPGTHETGRFDLWLRGLLPPPADPEPFRRIAKGIYDWADQRYTFYAGIERRRGGDERVDRWLEGTRVEGDWHTRNPLAARCGVADLYWLAKILRAEVSPRGVVRYLGRSWLSSLPSLAPDIFRKDAILRIEEVLRSVFDFACDLIQNAVQMAEYRELKRVDRDGHPAREWTMDWRAAHDQELEEIGKQRPERFSADGRSQARALAPESSGELSAKDKLSDQYWSKRVRTGECEENLVGVALSGGGIRSATFALGVLQRLKELDLLRRVDYLSTVSGGGYIGAWLVGNVRRSPYWLTRMTSWDESIGHLRRYSKYLAPRTGFLSADSWVIWVTWIRNAMLIQLTAVAWLSALFVAVLALKAAFDWSGSAAVNAFMHGVLTAGFVLLAGIISVNLWKRKWRPATQHPFVIVLAWLGSVLSAALLWSRTSPSQEYSAILATEWKVWPVYLSGLLGLAMFVLAFASVRPEKKRSDSHGGGAWWKFVGCLGAAGVSAGVIYLALCGVRYLFAMWTSHGKDQYGWYAYVFGPPLVLLGVTLAVVVFIGLVGRASADWRREWWTRYGSWLAIYGAAFLALSASAVFGHAWLGGLFALGETVKWGAVGGWLASVTAGVLAGHSSKTRGNGEGSSTALEWVARIGGVLFIAGTVLALSSLLHVVLVQVWLDDPGANWWEDLNLLLDSGWRVLLTLVVLVICATIFSLRFDLNTFGLNQFYRNRLVRCYLGATRWIPGRRKPHRFTGFDEEDDLTLTDLRFDPEPHFRGPFPIVNCSLNLGGSSDLLLHTRQSAPFTVTPLSCGADRPKVGFAPLRDRDGFAGGVSLGQAISISGAAASPNMGYNTSPLVSVLLTMFNVRLAWWFPNPGRTKWREGSPPISILYLVEEFLGLADETSDYVNVSDGGHFENLGIYELIRRRAKVIIASDAECDPGLTFGSLGNLIRICDTDFGANIDIDVASIRQQDHGQSRAHCAVGRITYSNGSLGYLIYLKASITGGEDVGIEQYRALHPDFPHQTTGDQFFTEDQFESYRRLGHHVAEVAFRHAESEVNIVELARKLYDVWTPGGFSNAAFVKHTQRLDRLWDLFRTSAGLAPLFRELMADTLGPRRQGAPTEEELCACLELVQLMEDVFLDLRLDDFWEHPDNRGWAMLFAMWAKSSTFRAAWSGIRRTFGIRFEYFCQQRLGLEADHPVVRV